MEGEREREGEAAAVVVVKEIHTRHAMQIKDLQIETRYQMSRPAFRLDFASQE